MKMVSAAKFARAERELKPARSYGVGTQSKSYANVFEFTGSQVYHSLFILKTGK